MKKKTTDTFLKEAKDKNDKITVIGEYVDCTTKILVCCNECGYQYYTKPGVVLNGHGCPKCSGNVGISHEEFLQRMESQNRSYLNRSDESEDNSFGKMFLTFVGIFVSAASSGCGIF